MNEKEFYKQAMKDMYYLCTDVILECEKFAKDKDYNVDWVLDIFQEQFSKLKQMYLEGKLE